MSHVQFRQIQIQAAAASRMKLKGEEGPCMDSAIDTPMAGERWHRGGGNDGRGGNERQTTERRCLNPPTAIRPGLNTAPPHISKGQGRYKGWLVLQKAWPGLCLKKRLNEEETQTPRSLNILRIPFHLKFTEEEGYAV